MSDLVQRLTGLAKEVSEGTELDESSWLALRASFGEVQAEFYKESNERGSAFGLASAQGRLLAFMQENLGEVVTASQLHGVAGISTWARRVRELRTEQGYEISSGANNPSLAVDQYRLESVGPNLKIASAWRTAKDIRSMNGAASVRILEYLKAVHPLEADKEQLAYVAKIQAWQRRVRELVEQGWAIDSSRTHPGLHPGTYRLRDLQQRTGRRQRSMKLRYQILDRDGFACRKCGRSPESDGVKLEVHHLEWHSRGGSDEESNLETLCSACHAGVHAVEAGSTMDELENPGAEFDYGRSS